MKDFFKYLNSHYDKIYVLSVEAASQRREKFARQFEGLNYSFFFGADKTKFSINEIEHKGLFSENLTRKNHRFSKTMKHGEIACAWSHKMIYQDMLQNNYNRVLIFEDDALPDQKMVKFIPKILTEIPADCELLMWGWNKNGIANFRNSLKQFVYHIQHKVGILKWEHSIIRNLYARPFSKYLRKAGFHDYTYAYAISKSAAEKLVAMQTPIQYLADNLLAHASSREIVDAYITWPQVFLHDSLPDGTHRDSYIR